MPSEMLWVAVASISYYLLLLHRRQYRLREGENGAVERFQSDDA